MRATFSNFSSSLSFDGFWGPLSQFKSFSFGPISGLRLCLVSNSVVALKFLVCWFVQFVCSFVFVWSVFIACCVDVENQNFQHYDHQMRLIEKRGNLFSFYLFYSLVLNTKIFSYWPSSSRGCKWIVQLLHPCGILNRNRNKYFPATGAVNFPFW